MRLPATDPAKNEPLAARTGAAIGDGEFAGAAAGESATTIDTEKASAAHRFTDGLFAAPKP